VHRHKRPGCGVVDGGRRQADAVLAAEGFGERRKSMAQGRIRSVMEEVSGEGI